ncbi:protein kinase domain-containing protein [Ditylenchus destructor]|uniref:Protein kinase domain-containing protein n=1 Tax=Ditylenchus destructor TaxID=166010 RepID=A0AAD4N0L3_9BILA|nr:protein kinase domain-containing protein [Ditylenchus destructor]
MGNSQHSRSPSSSHEGYPGQSGVYSPASGTPTFANGNSHNKYYNSHQQRQRYRDNNKRNIVPVINDHNNHVNGTAKKGNFFTQLFTKSRLDPLAITQPPHSPVGGEMALGEATMLQDRPALRLDSRLVCKYEVLSVVGKGSFSQVLRVQHRITKQFYAVKLVQITNSDFGAVNNELTILSRVQHPYVIKLEEVFRGVSKLFIVMEMASGGEMYDRVVAKGRYSEPEARQAVQMLLTGLAYLHTMHITHRDLKPENLLYSDTRPDARLLITDFGLAHQAKTTDDKMVETCGTPEYIAPEILLRIPYTNKVDMWAVGVITYILMSGIMPFDDDCRSRLYTHIIKADYVYYPAYWSGSELAKKFVDDLLETNLERRLTAVQALRHDWITGKDTQRATLSRGKHIQEEFTSMKPSMDPSTNANSDHNSMQRTKSTRSIRSVTRSDHGHRVDPKEVDKLANDLQRLAKNQRNQHNQGNSYQSKHYGVF